MAPDEALVQELSTKRLLQAPKLEAFDHLRTPLEESMRACVKNIESPNIRALLASIDEASEILSEVDKKLLKRADIACLVLQTFFALIYSNRVGEIVIEEDAEPIFESNWLPRAHQKEGRASDFLAKWSSFCEFEAITPNVALEVIKLRPNAARDLNELLGHSRFAETKSLEEWQIVWHGAFMHSDDFEMALADFRRKFDEREYEWPPALIMHAFGLRFELSAMGAITKSKAEVESDCAAYLADLERAKRPALNIESNVPRGPTDFLGYKGLGIVKIDEPEMKKLMGDLIELLGRRVVDSYPDVAQDLIAMIRTSPKQAAMELSGSGECWPSAVMHPIFKDVSARDFAHAILQCDPESQKAVLGALHHRADRSARLKDLSTELEFVQELRANLRTHSVGLKPNEKKRFDLFDNWYLEKLDTLLSACRSSTSAI